MYKFLMAALLVVSAPSFAMAGGGGGSTKGNGTITARNNSENQVLLVAVNPSDSVLSSTTISQFRSRGGQVANAGSATSFKNVRVGAHIVATLLVPANQTTLTEADRARIVTRTVGVSKGQTTTVEVQ